MKRPEVKVETAAETTTVFFSDRLDSAAVRPLWRQITQALERSRSRRLTFDLTQVTGIDSAGVALLRRLGTYAARRRIACEYAHVPATIADFLHYVDAISPAAGTLPEVAHPGAVVRAGEQFLARLRAGRAVAEFTGNFLLGAAALLAHPRRLRWREILFHLQRSGAEAMLFVSSLSALMGFIMGLQATATLTEFGAGIRIADVVTVGTVKEMAPLLTAIILAGRSGAAFAAEIGTMRIRQEIDALRVMGFEPINFLVLPRVLALVLAGPLLTMIAAAAGILGGAVIGFLVLDLTFFNYLVAVGKSLNTSLLLQGLIKSFGFSVVLGVNGCYHGLQTGTAPEDVGNRTTAATVTGIMLIVLSDALFSGIFYVYRI